MKKKKIIIASILAFALMGGGWYAYSEFTRKVEDLDNVKPDMRLTAGGLVSAFEANEDKANELYLDKVIAVKGMVKNVEKNDRGHFTVILGEEGASSSVRCSMDSTHQQDVASIPAGSIITMKGACTGFNSDELLGSDVILNRAVMERN